MNLIKLLSEEMFGDKPIIEPTKDCWLAGGAVRGWFTGSEKLSDVDVFGVSADALKAFQSERLTDFKEVGSNPNAVSLSNGKTLVQLIVGQPRPTVTATFDSFDFTLCQFAWAEDGIWATSKALVSTLRNHLEIHKIQQPFALDSLRRAFKYQRKGFEPCVGTLKALAEALQLLTPEEIATQVSISPGGGKRIFQFD